MDKDDDLWRRRADRVAGLALVPARALLAAI
jgi:hypothetical protein